MPGAAKSSTGRVIATKLNRPFFDGDDVYVSLYGETIPDTFRLHGEEEFRRRERDVYERLGGLDGAIVACGGGVVLSEDNMNALRRNGVVAYLYASPEALFERVGRSDTRPLLSGGGIEKVRALYAERAPLYEKYSDFRVDNTRLGTGRCADRVIALYNAIVARL